MKCMLILFCVVALTASLAADNLVAEGDFENGDLRGVLPRWWQKHEYEPYPMNIPPGWVEAGPDTVKGWQGGAPVPVQFFRENAPMYVYELTTDEKGIRHRKRVAVAREVPPKTGYSVGWTLSGSTEQGRPWISQIIYVPPGKYLMDASWDVLARGPSADSRTSGVFMVNVDQYVERYEVESPAFRREMRSIQSRGRWRSQSVKDYPIETKTGGIEVRLMFVERGSSPIPKDAYSCVAFDNITLELKPAAE